MENGISRILCGLRLVVLTDVTGHEGERTTLFFQPQYPLLRHLPACSWLQLDSVNRR